MFFEQSTDRLSTLLLVLAALTAFNLLVPLLVPSPPSLPVSANIERSESPAFNPTTTDKFSRLFTGPSDPREWDIALEDVALTVEDSVNFQLDTPEGAAQWRALQPPSNGFVTGADNTTYRLSMFHAPDCLDIIRRGVLARKADRQTLTAPDVHLCLDYLRQTIQCRADIQLEQVRSEYGGKSVQPFVTHSNCRDWSKVYAELEERHR